MVITDTNLSLAGHHQLMQSGEFYFFYLTLNYVTPAFDFFLLFVFFCLFVFITQGLELKMGKQHLGQCLSLPHQKISPM